MEKFHDYMWLHTPSIESTAGNKNRLFPSPFRLSNSSNINLAGDFRRNHVAACSTALRSATEKNEWDGYFFLGRTIQGSVFFSFRGGGDGEGLHGKK